MKFNLENIVAIQEQVGCIVADIEELRKGYQNILSEIDNGPTTEDYQTISDDMLGLEKDFQKLRSDFDIEFDKNTHLREVYASVPEIKRALESFSEFARHELKEKVERDEYVQKMRVQDQKIESSIKELSESKKQYLDIQKKIKKIQENRQHGQIQSRDELSEKSLTFLNYKPVLIAAFVSGLVGVLVGLSFMQIQMKPKWTAELNSFRTQSEKRVEEMLSMPQVAELINEKARLQTELQINNTFKRAIQIYVELIKNKTDALISDMENNSEEAMTKLSKSVEMSRLIAESQAGQRVAFDELLNIANSRESVFKNTASQAIVQVVSEINAKNSSNLPMNIKEFVVSEDYASIDNFKKIYQAMDDIYKPTLLLELWHAAGIEKREKINFLISEMRVTNSLILLARIIELVDIEAKLFEPLSNYKAYLNWWDENQFNFAPVAEAAHKSKFFF